MKMTEERRQAELELFLELNQTLLSLGNEVGSMAQFFKGAVPSAVLFSGTVLLNDEGQWSQTYPVPFAAVAVVNWGASTLTVAGDGLQAIAPTSGPGVFQVAPFASGTQPVLSSTLSIYGSAGAQVNVVVLERPQDPSRDSMAASVPGVFSAGAQVAVGAAAVELAPASTARRALTITNVGAAAMRIGLAGVTATTGFARLEAGQQVTIRTAQAVYAIRETASSTTALVASVT
jgi:hypothetical protein